VDIKNWRKEAKAYVEVQGPPWAIGSVMMMMMMMTTTLVPRLNSVIGKMKNKCGVVGGVIINGGNRNTVRKTTPISLLSPQNLHDLTWDRPRAAPVGT
jgi:hypothetical protein